MGEEFSPAKNAPPAARLGPCGLSCRDRTGRSPALRPYPAEIHLRTVLLYKHYACGSKENFLIPAVRHVQLVNTMDWLFFIIYLFKTVLM
jgi:hypothetical protein